MRACAFHVLMQQSAVCMDACEELSRQGAFMQLQSQARLLRIR